VTNDAATKNLTVVRKRLDELTIDPANARTHDKRNLDATRSSPAASTRCSRGTTSGRRSPCCRKSRDRNRTRSDEPNLQDDSRHRCPATQTSPSRAT